MKYNSSLWILFPLLAFQSTAFADSWSAAVQACSGQIDDSVRLKCYDQAAAQFKTPDACRSTHCPPIRSDDTALSPKSPSSDEVFAPPGLNSDANQFGLTAAQMLHERSGGKLALELKQITAKIVTISLGHSGRLLLQLENSQLWEQTEDGPDLKLGIGSPVTIERGMLGAYFLSGQSKRAAIKVKRIR